MVTYIKLFYNLGKENRCLFSETVLYRLMDEPKADKVTTAFRLLKTTQSRLKKAIAKTGLTQSSYVEKALLAEFKKDGV
jgi:hypothetical protein